MPAHCPRARGAEKTRSNDNNRTFNDGLYSINRNLFGSFPATRRQSVATPLPCGRRHKNYLWLAQFLQFLGCVCRFTLNRATSSPRGQTYSTRCHASCPLKPNWKTVLSRSVAIRAEVRIRIYWTKVPVDPKVSVNIIFTGCTGPVSLQRVHEAGRLFAAIANFNLKRPRSKCVGANVIIRCQGMDRYLRPIDSVLNSVAQSKRKSDAIRTNVRHR